MGLLLNPLYNAVSWVMVAFHTLLGPIFGDDSGWAWGLAIVGLVIVIRTLLIPLFVKQIKAQRGLQVLQPEIKKIQEKYKNDRERQSQELMKLYRETGTNPLASCLPILAQAPIFYALFHVLDGIADGKARGVLTQDQVDSAGHATIFGAPLDATFLGTDDMTVKAVTVIMILLMSAAQFTTQRQLMVKNLPASSANNPFMQQQKVLLYVFPLMFAVFGINFPVGVLLYWLTTNLWSMGQQFFVIRRMPAPGSKAAEAREARLRAKGKLSAETTTASGGTGDDVPEAPGQPARKQPVRQPRSKRRKKR